MKYSSCLWPSEESSLGDAEDTILASYCKEAKLGKGLRGVGEGEVEAGKEGEGLRILDLGCGWGSLGLFLAEVSRPRLVRVTVYRLSQLDGHRFGAQLIDSTTPSPRSPCCPTRKPRNSISTLPQPKRDSRMSQSSLAMSTSTISRRRASMSFPFFYI